MRKYYTVESGYSFISDQTIVNTTTTSQCLWESMDRGQKLAFLDTWEIKNLVRMNDKSFNIKNKSLNTS